MEKTRLTNGRWVSKCCFLGLCGWAFSCGATGIKGLGGSHGAALPGADYILPRRLGKEVAGVLAHGGPGKSAALSENKGTTKVAPGINAFLSPPTPGTGVASDGSLGSGKVSYNSSDQTYTIPDTVGRQIGGNLFESFSQFNLLKGEVADFLGPANVADIIARITRGISSIDGEIESDIQRANLFLINPAGFMFGPGASLNVSGAFTVSTANYVKLADGGKFNTNLGGDDMLTAGSVSAFGFVSNTPAPVSFSGSQLSVPAGTGMNVIAGDVTLVGATLSAPSGGLTVFSAASAGIAPFSLNVPGAGYAAASVSAFGAVSLGNGSTIAIDGAGGGVMVIRSGMISVDDSSISSANTSSAIGGDIIVNASGTLELAGGGQINSSTSGLGNGGDVTVTAQDITISGASTDGQFESGIGAESVSATQGGAAGNVVVNAGELDLEAGGTINSLTFGLGSGGGVKVTAQAMTISGASPDQFASGVYADSVPSTQGAAAGDAGNVVVSVAGRLDIEGGGTINSTTDGLGSGGIVTVTAQNITISGASTNGQFESGIGAESVSPTQGGAAGNVVVLATRRLEIEGGGEISSSTDGLGKGGTVKVTGQDITISGATPNDQTSGILADSDSPTQGGAAGNVVVKAATLDMEGGGEISSSTFGLGKGGGVNVKAQEINISGATPDAQFSSGIYADSAPPINSEASGNAGDVVVNVAGNLDMEGGGEINSSTYGTGAGGAVNVTAQEVTISGGSTITAASFSFTAAAGNVMVKAKGSLDIASGGEIASSTLGLGNGGSVNVTAQNMTVSGATEGIPSEIVAFSDCETEGGGVAGNVVVNVAGAIDLETGVEISSSTFGLGTGGNVEVTARNIILSGGEITAESESSEQGGAAGDVSVNAGTLDIEGGGDINSSTLGLGKGGSVNVTAQEINISGATPGVQQPSGIFAESTSSTQGGAAGSISIQCDNLILSAGGTISTNAEAASAGDITVNAQQDVTLESQGEISSSAGIGGGNIAVTAGTLLYLLDSSITAEAGALRNANGESNYGNGGNITLDPEFIVLNDSLISANAAAGQGGNIILEANYYLNSGSTITATGATSGTVTITSPELDLSAALVGLPASPIAAQTQLQETCAMALNGDFSSFLAVGQGDIEATPDEEQGGSGDSGEHRRERSGHPKSAHKAD
jgi:filamentous hemagglutinin family protein